MTAPFYTNGPYGYSGSPYVVGSVPAYPVPGPVGPGPLFNGQYATNLVSDPTADYMMDLTNATQSAYYGMASSPSPPMPGRSNSYVVDWYNDGIAPLLRDADAMTKSILGGSPQSTAIPTGGTNPYMQPQSPYAQQQPQSPYAQQPPPTELPEALQDHGGKSSGNSMLADIGGFAAAGAAIGAVCGGGVFSWATVGIGAGIGAVVGGLKHFFWG